MSCRRAPWLVRCGAWVLGAVAVAPALAQGVQDGDARARIDRLIGAAACHDDGDCRTSALGQQACGGPAGYVAWSARETDPAALAVALEHYRRDQGARQRSEGRVSTCGVKIDPGAHCRKAQGAQGLEAAAAASGTTAGRCTLRRAGSPPTR